MFKNKFNFAKTAVIATATVVLLASCMQGPHGAMRQGQPGYPAPQGQWQNPSQGQWQQPAPAPVQAQGAVAQQYNYTGSLSGYESRVYQVTAQKGQLLRVVRSNTSPKLEINLRYVGNDSNAANQPLRGDFQVLPASGTYEIIIGQTRNDARKAPNVELPYNLQVFVENMAATQQPVSVPAQGINQVAGTQVTYVCDRGATFNVVYSGNRANLTINGQPQSLELSRQYGGQDNPVFANKDYMISVGVVTPGNYQQSELYSILSFKRSANGEAIYQNCQVKR